MHWQNRVIFHILKAILAHHTFPQTGVTLPLLQAQKHLHAPFGLLLFCLENESMCLNCFPLSHHRTGRLQGEFLYDVSSLPFQFLVNCCRVSRSLTTDFTSSHSRYQAIQKRKLALVPAPSGTMQMPPSQRRRKKMLYNSVVATAYWCVAGHLGRGGVGGRMGDQSGVTCGDAGLRCS